MGLTSFGVSRLHCFWTPASLRIAPLTLVFGHNNAGKSTLLRAVPLLAASVGASAPGALDLTAEAARGATYHDLRSRFGRSNELTFALAWSGSGVALEHVTFQFMEEPGGGHVLKTLSVHRGDQEVVHLRVSIDPVGHYELLREGRVIWSGPFALQGVLPIVPKDAGFPVDATAELDHLREQFAGFRTSVEWLTAVRATVPRRQPIPPVAGARLSTGAWAQTLLASESTPSRRALVGVVSAELEAMFQCVLHVDVDEGDLLLRGAPVGVTWRVPLADLGEGITQVLPVITLCCMAERGDLGTEPLLCIEQPEMHLHADAERLLALFLARVVRSPSRPRLILETHSEILLSAFLIEVARGNLPQEQLALHWVGRESPAVESTVRSLTIDAQGRPAPWPPGAFSERTDLARELFIARRS